MNEIVVWAGADDPSLGAHNPERNGLAQPERIANGDHPVADFKTGRLPKGDARQGLVGFDLDQRQIRLFV